MSHIENITKILGIIPILTRIIGKAIIPLPIQVAAINIIPVIAFMKVFFNHSILTSIRSNSEDIKSLYKS